MDLVRGALPASSLCLLVVGSGAGEGIFVRIPPDYWLAVDSTELRTAEGRIPAHRLLTDAGFRSSAIALTHPHLDHVAGMRALVDDQSGGSIGCSKLWLSELLRGREKTLDAEMELRASVAESAIAAIGDRWDIEPETRWPLEAGSELTLGDGRVRVLYPTPEAVANYSMRNGDANAVSSPMLIEWRSVALLLGADLPSAQWRKIGASDGSGSLADHDGLKVPHHGSKRAIDASFASGATTRVWVVAPWTRSTGPPRFEDGGDVEALLGWNKEVHLTCLPLALRVRLQGGDRVSRSDLVDQIVRSKFGDLTVDVEEQRQDETGCWVLASFDEDGAVHLTHGADAVMVVP